MAEEGKSKNINKSSLSSIEEVIEEAKLGRIFILVTMRIEKMKEIYVFQQRWQRLMLLTLWQNTLVV
jgi:hypothetical protein